MVVEELDITDSASIDRVVAKLIADHPGLTVLINNAASCNRTRPPAKSMTRSWFPPSRQI
jgi:NAD(P)-dependent dehydrogenase (short-subunit alcohol dehydrogenase family)